MSAYLEEHLPHLQSLHAQLALPATALSSDQARLESAIRNAVTALVREREEEVDRWREAIDGEKKELSSVAKALGEMGRNVLAATRRDSLEDEPLPGQHAKWVKQKEEVEKVYTERLKRIEELRATLEVLSNLLGPPFEPPSPLQPVASSSKSVAPPGPSRSSLNRNAGNLVSGGGYRRSASGGTLVQAIEEGKKEIWLDVGEEITEILEVAVQKAMEERVSRIQQLSDFFRDLLFLHAELVLPPIPLSHPHHFPIQLLPSQTTEERPGAHAAYEKTLSRYISTNQSAVEEEEEGNEKGLKGLEGVEPEVGLMSWAEELVERWTNERTSREARIQELYDQIEPLWYRLEIEQGVMDLFMEMNRGCGEAVIGAYEIELERILEIRRSSLSSFVVSARKEIEMLWVELMLSEDEKGDFGPFIDDDYTEELLLAHEEEAERLRAEVESKASLLPKVREWHALKLDEDELERNANDPNRFSARGGAMLREEKLRKRVGILLPKVETDLLSSLPKWEAANGRPFMVQGERVVDKIHDAREAKEMAKEAKKRAKQGLAPAKIVSRQTPTVSTVRSQTSTSTLRKREAPTPTPLGSYQSNTKRQRTGPPWTIRAVPRPARTASASSRDARDPGSSPTPICGLPRPVPKYSRTFSGQSASSVFSTASSASDRTRVASITWSAKPPISNVAALGRADGRRPRSESFKPRQSVAGGLLAARSVSRPSWGLVEEEEGGEDDVF